jgi:YD repeat-containing protein
MNTSLYSNTPTIIVRDNQGLTVRTLAYHRHPDTPDSTDERITRHRYDTRRLLTAAGGTEQVIVRSLTYSAAGQKLREEHGNGVVTTYTYEPQTQRLTGIKTGRPAGHVSGEKSCRTCAISTTRLVTC